MNRSVILLLSLLSIVAQAQQPRLLREAAHCLVSEKQNWLGLSQDNQQKVTLGYLLDRKSWPGKEYLYVVVYTGPTRNEGLIFGIAIEREAGVRLMTINNNARFVSSKRGIDWVPGQDPLGGIWTQEHLKAAIKQIAARPPSTYRIRDLRTSMPSLRCNSYVSGATSTK